MDQQYHAFPPNFQGQGPETAYDPSCFQGVSVPIESVAMDRGLSNNSINTENSESAWTEISWSTNITSESQMSWEKVPSPHIKWEDNWEDDSYNNSYSWDDTVDKMEHSPTGSQGFQTPLLQPSSFTEPSFDTRPIDPRPTPSSLRWTPYCPLLELYKFVVGKGGKDQPYFQLLEGCKVTEETPARVFLDSPKQPKKGAYPCQYPWGCTGKQTVFTRPADLERHYKNVHAAPDQKDLFNCDYTKCGRYHDPFTRKDHYRDHLRDYHKEDLGSAKAQKKQGRKDWAAEQAAWLAERKISSRWWRCVRCLERRQVLEDGWECPTCKTSCEQERIDVRMKRQQRRGTAVVDQAEEEEQEEAAFGAASSVTATATSAAPELYSCDTCVQYPGWALSEMGEWVPCPDCRAQPDYYDYGTSRRQ